jgi:hypothetical protein
MSQQTLPRPVPGAADSEGVSSPVGPAPGRASWSSPSSRAVWAGCTVAFEFLVFHYVSGQSWAQLLDDYDLTQRRVWGLVVVGIAAAPALSRRMTAARSGAGAR